MKYHTMNETLRPKDGVKCLVYGFDCEFNFGYYRKDEGIFCDESGNKLENVFCWAPLSDLIPIIGCRSMKGQIE